MKYFLVVIKTGVYKEILICFPNVYENQGEEISSRQTRGMLAGQGKEC